MEKINKENMRKLREEMVDKEIGNCGSGYFLYKGKMYELVLILKEEEVEDD